MARAEPPYAADERTMLVSFLDHYRETMVMMLDDLTEEQARWAPALTANALIGMINHLAYVEDWWFNECFLGAESALPQDIFEADRDAEMKPPADQTVAFTIERYRQRWERSNEIAATASLDDVVAHEKMRARGVTLRWILVHMIEETARHAGHADITRELIDGTTGI
jgi:uncharacterized damage-inducible protein DinB